MCVGPNGEPESLNTHTSEKQEMVALNDRPGNKLLLYVYLHDNNWICQAWLKCLELNSGLILTSLSTLTGHIFWFIRA